MLILAAVTITVVMNGGLFQQTQSAVNKTDIEQTKELVQAELLNLQLDNYDVGIDKDIIDELLGELVAKGIITFDTNYTGDRVIDNGDETFTIKGIKTAKGNSMDAMEIANIAVGGSGLIANGSWNGTVNTPKLGAGMTAVAWDDNKNEYIPKTNAKWYNYTAQTEGTESGGTSKWANAKTEDGSYWVWVPRYEYKISGTAVDVNFIQTSKTTPTAGYLIHPAFQNGTSNNFINGEWDSELSGIWVAKFEMSGETSGVASTPGNVPTDTTVKMVSKPNVSSWRAIYTGAIHANALKYDTDIGHEEYNSHQMKNSEWGAVAYLTESEYGRNGTEVTINNSSGYYTGRAGTLASPSTTSAAGTYEYNTTGGILASSTGNIYGIYDLSRRSMGIRGSIYNKWKW
jgi:hypothetical protein